MQFLGKLVFPAWNQLRHQMFDKVGTFPVDATQQILDTLSQNKGRVITQIGDLIHAPRSHSLGIFASALASAASLTASPASAQSPYDGLWNVTVVTKSGNCEPSSSSTLTVSDGKISAAGADVHSSIGREGLVRVTIRGAYANGQLIGNAGS